MSMESANTALANTPEQRPMKSIFGQNPHPADTSQVEFPTPESGGPVPLRERDKTERFARDINTKIDALEEQLGRSTTLMERSQEMVKAALEELRERIMGVRTDTEEKLDASRDEILTNRAEIDAQREALQASRSEIQLNRDEIHAQSLEINAHHAEISAHRNAIMEGHERLQSQLGELNQQRDQLHAQRNTLTMHGENLSAQQADIAELGAQHLDLQQQVIGLSQEHDATVTKVDALGDQLYEASVAATTHRNETQKNFRVLTGALIGTSVLTLGLFSYFLFNPIAAPDAMETQMAALTTGLEQQRVSAVGMNGEIQRIGTGLTILDGNVTQIQEGQRTLQDGQQTSNEQLHALEGKIVAFETAITDLRARLRASRAGGFAAPVLTLHDDRWLASRAPGHYVIQLVGTHEYDSLVQFINRYSGTVSKHPLSYAQGHYLGREWHNLMYGDFASMGDAKAALAALPPPLQVNKPWVRKMSTVQGNIRRY